MKTFSLIIWMILYKLAWLGCVLGGGVYGYPLLGSLPMLCWVFFWIISVRSEQSNVLKTTIIAGCYGLAVDSLMIWSEVMLFSEAAQFGPASPIWMIALWLGFGSITQISLGKLYGLWFIAALIGAIGGPMAYLGGVNMQAVSFAHSKQIFVSCVAIEWAIAVPLLIWLAGPPKVVKKSLPNNQPTS